MPFLRDQLAANPQLTADLRDRVRHYEGLFVGLLSDLELYDFDRAVDLGIAERSYEGGSGFMGLAKVRVR